MKDFPVAAPRSPAAPPPGELKKQRDQAFACLVFSLTITAACLLSIFSEQRRREFEEAGAALASHQAMLKEAEVYLRRNEEVLRDVENALKQLPAPAR